MDAVADELTKFKASSVGDKTGGEVIALMRGE
jgi:hypothetical protein